MQAQYPVALKHNSTILSPPASYAHIFWFLFARFPPLHTHYPPSPTNRLILPQMENWCRVLESVFRATRGTTSHGDIGGTALRQGVSVGDEQGGPPIPPSLQGVPRRGVPAPPARQPAARVPAPRVRPPGRAGPPQRPRGGGVRVPALREVPCRPCHPHFPPLRTFCQRNSQKQDVTINLIGARLPGGLSFPSTHVCRSPTVCFCCGFHLGYSHVCHTLLHFVQTPTGPVGNPTHTPPGAAVCSVPPAPPPLPRPPPAPMPSPPPLRDFGLAHPGLILWGSLLPALGCLLALSWLKARCVPRPGGRGGGWPPHMEIHLRVTE